MKFHYILKFSLCLICIMLATACNKNLGDINIDPNNASEDTKVTADLVLPSAMESAFDQYFSYVGFEFTDLAVQHMAKVTGYDTDRYTYANSSLSVFWNAFYSEGLIDFEKVKKVAAGNPNYIAIADIMQCWQFSLLTDAYGDIPYSEALKGAAGIYQPKYDTQEAIYTDLIQRLTATNTRVDLAGNPVKGDIIFAGNMMKWKRFANSLRLRLLLRISAKKDVKAELQQMVSNPTENPLMASNTDNFQLVYLPNSPNDNPFYQTVRSRNDFRLSKVLVDKLKQLNDPRITVYANPTEAGGVYEGYPNGQAGLSQTLYSKPGVYFTNPTTPAVGLPYTEVLFLLTEAAYKQYITGDFKDYYNKAIKASFDQYNGVATANGAVFNPPPIGAPYFSQPSVTLSGTNDLEQIMTQKWIALFAQTFEPWIEWKRTGFPVLTASAGNTNNNKIPVRMPYPITEQTLNGKNYQEAVSRQGADDLNTKVWWNK